MVTPYTWRNFVTGASTAREGQMERFFLQKRHFIHKLSVKKQETGQKMGKNPPKKGVFISPSDQLLWQCHKSWSEELRKTPFFGGFLPVFCPVSCFFTDSLYITRIFWKKIGPSWLFLAAGTTDTKFRHSTGVATANSTNKDQKYKSVELGDQLIQREPERDRASQRDYEPTLHFIVPWTLCLRVVQKRDAQQ